MNQPLRGSFNHSRNEDDCELVEEEELARLSREIESRRINKSKKPSAFKSSSSNSSKNKRVAFEENIRQSGRNYVKSSLHKRRTTSQEKERNNNSDLFIQDVESEKAVNDSRILIHLSAQGKLTQSQVRQEVLYLKQLQKAVKEEILKLGRTMKKMNLQLTRELQSQLQNYKSRIQRQHETQKSLMKESLISIQRNLKYKTEENNNLVKELQDLKEQKRTLRRIEDNSFSAKSLGPCPNCKLYEIKINSIREDAIVSAQTISKLQSENQHLQEVVFDLEQQVVGIDLKVEKKLKVALENISDFQPQRREDNHLSQQIFENMTKDIERLTLQCKQYQHLCTKEDELTRKETELSTMKKQYQRKNEALLEALARNQQTIDRNYEREHQLLIAEQQFFKKFEDIRQKEIELSKWEAILTEKSIQSNNKLPAFKPSSLGKAEQSEIDIYRKSNEDNFTEYRVTLPPRPNDNPTDKQYSQLGRASLPNQYQPRTYQKPLYQDAIKESRKYNSRQNHPENIYSSKLGKEYQSRKINPSQSSKNFQHRSNLVERTSAVNSRSKYEARKVSPYLDKGTSPAKSFRSSNVSHLARSNIKHNENINGLESKLDRLRDELKRELESIK